MALVKPHEIETIKSGRQALSIMAKRGNLSYLKLIIDSEADLNHQDQ